MQPIAVKIPLVGCCLDKQYDHYFRGKRLQCDSDSLQSRISIRDEIPCFRILCIKVVRGMPRRGTQWATHNPFGRVQCFQ